MFHRPWLKNLPPSALAIAATLPRKHIDIRLSADEAVLEIFGDIGGDFDYGVTLSEISNALNEASRAKSLTIRINSPGGVAADGIAAYNLIRKFSGTVTTVNMGMAASAAGLILMAGQRALAVEGSLFMMHEPHGVTVGNASAMDKTASILRKMNGQITEMFVRRTGLSRNQVESMLAAETWLDAKESKQFKIVDDVVADTPFSNGSNRIAAHAKPTAKTTWQEVELAELRRLHALNAEIDRRAEEDKSRYERNRRRFAKRHRV